MGQPRTEGSDMSTDIPWADITTHWPDAIGAHALREPLTETPCDKGCMAPGSSPHYHTEVVGWRIVGPTYVIEVTTDMVPTRDKVLHPVPVNERSDKGALIELRASITRAIKALDKLDLHIPEEAVDPDTGESYCRGCTVLTLAEDIALEIEEYLEARHD